LYLIHFLIQIGRFELYNVFALLVGVLVFDNRNEHSAAEFVLFEVLLVLLFFIVCIVAVVNEFWYGYKRRKSFELMLKMSSSGFESQEKPVRGQKLTVSVNPLRRSQEMETQAPEVLQIDDVELQPTSTTLGVSVILPKDTQENDQKTAPHQEMGEYH
jgi:hypothetical protein